MKKRRAQTMVEFAGIAILVLIIILVGLYKFSDKLADFFGGNSPEKKFNYSRTVKFEKPEDLLSDVTVTFDGTIIEPPVEKVIRDGLTSGSYIQTSGSAARMAEMGKIMEEYILQLKNLSVGGAPPKRTAFINALDDFLLILRDVGDTNADGSEGFLEIYTGYAPDQLLEKKLSAIEMATSLGQTAAITAVKNTGDQYALTLGTGNRQDIIKTYIDDLTNIGNFTDYYIDPTLYVEYLGEEKKSGDITQAQTLVDAIQANLGTMTTEEKLHLAGLVKIYYGGGYSQASPSAYNSERMCNTFAGTMLTPTDCEIPTP